MTLGIASDPYTAILIRQIAIDKQIDYPLAEHGLQREIYVDDVQIRHETN